MRGTPGLPLLHGLTLLPGEVALLLELVGEEDAVMPRVLQQAPQSVILSATEGRSVRDSCVSRLAPAEEPGKDVLDQKTEC